MNEQAQPLLEINAPALPKGGGAIQSIGKGWGRVGTTGAASLALPLPISKAPNRDLVPALGLGYSSDVGNSPFGIGWRLTTNAITLRTTRGVPKYDGSDQVVGPGGDVWMPEKSDDGSPVSRTVSEYNGVQIGMHRVVRHWPRVEGAFDLIEHWTRIDDADNPAGFWLVHGADGSLHCYGKTEASRRADSTDKSHVGVWLIDESLNLRGEHVVYLYQAEVEAPAA
ncbi:MAG TPA: SpvB/TcaC N-terminal domain-containing protein, partial [Pseudomonas sp.]|nr:SpvB/TcaC N-terminal domain-containing protein [Pseudomonas sp.]